ncbi:hypothetical protein FA95DRAFT_1589352 [Auriscalpium vulgare]|uniref:Uncharacterized protein n=1 Tax=Auriscalpium vulgare TaxID=40419 RepID=A0ACB8RT59_9AGAM|nr:hypothetical protein FA95DRAFT_1589352 [Auriscalpium vulgare]
MATEAPKKTTSTKPKPKDKKVSSKSSGNERLKTVVRRLPPNLPEEIFWQSVQPWVTEDAVLWKAYYPGKLRKKLNKENIHSRACIAFKTEELLATFSHDYDGHTFRDKAGNESQAVVEFAPYQKIPLEKKKIDSRNATIDKDEEFIAFLQSLEQPATKAYDAEQLLETLIASTERQPQPKSTPLLEALKAEKSAQKDKEAIQRNHPHYKDGAAASKKEEARKKAAAAAAAAAKASGDAPATLGKRAAKKAAAAAAAAAQKGAPQNAAPQGKLAHPGPPANVATKAGPPTAPKGRGGRPPQVAASETQRLKSPIVPTASSSAVAAATPSASASTSDTPTAPTPAASTAPGGRRPRPVLGIASRQFEAALSGAGVAKGRRERPADNAGSTPASEEKRERGGGGKGKERETKREQAAAGGTSTPAAGGQAAVAVGVLPAPAILQKPGPRSEPGAASSGHGAPPEGGRGGKPRGRGRGRGVHRGG